MSVVVKIEGAASGAPTPHDGRYVLFWNPHSAFGFADLVTTDDRYKARQFRDAAHALEEYRTVSNVEKRRPTDGKPNRPLSAFTVTLEKL